MKGQLFIIYTTTPTCGYNQPFPLAWRCIYLGAVPIAASPYLRGFAKGLAEIKTVDYCQKWQKRLL